MRKDSFILGENFKINLNSHETWLNDNILVVGSSGSGKSRTIVEPNLYYGTGSYIISDPKGSLFRKYEKFFRKKKYKVYKIDLIHPSKGNHYNPLWFIETDRDVLKVATILNGSEDSFNKDPFWDKSSYVLLTALIYYLIETSTEEEDLLNFVNLLDCLTKCIKNESNKSPMDSLMKDLFLSNHDSKAVSNYLKVECSAKTYNCIVLTLQSKLGILDSPSVSCMLTDNDLELKEIGQKNTVVFVTCSDTDRSLDVLANLFFTQALAELTSYADQECKDGELPVPVMFLMDDFATNVVIDDFPKSIATIRSRNISAVMMIQAEAQLEDCYGKSGAKTIIGNCDTYVYLGSNDIETASSISVRMDKPIHWVLALKPEECLVFRRGELPKLVQKCKSFTNEKKVL